MEKLKNKGIHNIIDLRRCFPGNSDNYSDVNITCSDGQKYAHRIVLASISKIFYSEFKLNTWDETISVIAPDFTSSEIHQYLASVYNCENLEKFSSINQLFGCQFGEKNEEIVAKEEILVKEEIDIYVKDDVDSVPSIEEIFSLQYSPKLNSQKKKKKKVDLEKLVWKHFHIETASNDSDSLVLCNHCDARYHMSVIDVNSMKVHLEVMHQLEIENKSKKPRKRKNKTYESKEVDLNIKKDEQLINVVESDNYQNDNCQKVLTSKYFTKTNTGLGEWMFICNICSSQITLKNLRQNTMRTLNEHLFNDHRIRKQRIGTGPRNFELWNHFKENPDPELKYEELKFECLICSKLISRQARTRHLLNHNVIESEPSPCSICGKVFNNHLSRRDHEKFHRMERKYCCHMCDMKFMLPQKLERHLRVHTGEKPHQCTECGRQFAEASHLKTHYNVHSNEKPYECPRCFKKFKSRSSKNSHKCNPL